MPDRASLSVSPETAIAAALSQNWKDAIRINTLLIKQNTNDIDALNRLGYALLMAGKLTVAKRIFQKVLTADPYNQIALKNTKKLSSLKKRDVVGVGKQSVSPLHFLEEPGKTKLALLVNPAPSKVLVTLSSGQEVQLKPKNHCVEIRSNNNTYLGALPDDLSFKLLKLLAAGNRYQVIVKSVGKNALTVILRELFRGKRFANQPSFTSSSAFIRGPRTDEKPTDGPNVTPTGEEEIERPRDEERA